jgi:hypothetical protein
MVCGIAIAVVIAAERTRRDAAIERSRGRALLSEAFQSSLVPVPKPPTFVLVRVRFEPGDDRLQLGGDFFDALELPDGSMGYVIGDVCGHGAQAAALGSAIRAGWKSVAVHAPADPVLWCQTLQAAFFGYGRHNDTFVTMNTGRIVAGDPSIRYVSAGHPWPVVIDGTVRLETPNVGPPLGISAGTSWTISQATVPEDATMLLYTDGLIENRAHGSRHAPDERELLDYLRETSVLDLDDLLRHFGPNGFGDDVAVLAITNTDQAHLHLHTSSNHHT